MVIKMLFRKVKGLGLFKKEYQGRRFRVVYKGVLCLDLTFQSTRFRVAPKGILFGVDNGVFVL
jgi:hypothetical protein